MRVKILNKDWIDNAAPDGVVWILIKNNKNWLSLVKFTCMNVTSDEWRSYYEKQF